MSSKKKYGNFLYINAHIAALSATNEFFTCNGSWVAWEMDIGFHCNAAFLMSFLLNNFFKKSTTYSRVGA